MWKEEYTMNMIWHNSISSNFDVILYFQKIKPFIYKVVTITYLKQRKPLITSKSYIMKGSLTTMCGFGGHGTNVTTLSLMNPHAHGGVPARAQGYEKETHPRTKIKSYLKLIYRC